MTSCYIASRFSRKPEMQAAAADLHAIGIAVTSRWMRPDYRWNGVPEDAISEADLGQCAIEDMQDIAAADVMVCFTEQPGSTAARGGRHVEAGYALALGKPLLIVGPRENIFYMVPGVVQYDTWRDAVAWLREQRGEEE